MKAVISDTTRGRDALALLQDGAIGEMSIGYDSVKGATDYSKHEGKTVRNLREIKLYEFSLVTFPANEQAVVTGLKEAPPETDADEGDEQEPDAEPEVKAGRTISRATLAKLKAARDVIDELCSMGEMSDVEDEQPEENKSAPAGVPQAADEQHDEQAGPVKPPTDAKKLLLEIEILESQIHTLEV